MLKPILNLWSGFATFYYRWFWFFSYYSKHATFVKQLQFYTVYVYVLPRNMYFWYYLLLLWTFAKQLSYYKHRWVIRIAITRVNMFYVILRFVWCFLKIFLYLFEAKSSRRLHWEWFQSVWNHDFVLKRPNRIVSKMWCNKTKKIKIIKYRKSIYKSVYYLKIFLTKKILSHLD